MKHEIRSNSDITVRLATTAAAPWACCNGSHHFCWYCGIRGHLFSFWQPQRLFAFEERVCTCCSHAESRSLPESEEEI